MRYEDNKRFFVLTAFVLTALWRAVEKYGPTESRVQ